MPIPSKSQFWNVLTDCFRTRKTNGRSAGFELVLPACPTARLRRGLPERKLLQSQAFTFTGSPRTSLDLFSFFFCSLEFLELAYLLERCYVIPQITECLYFRGGWLKLGSGGWPGTGQLLKYTRFLYIIKCVFIFMLRDRNLLFDLNLRYQL